MIIDVRDIFIHEENTYLSMRTRSRQPATRQYFIHAHDIYSSMSHMSKIIS